MSILHAVILGIVQGITEYIPVSSSAHLLMVSKLLGIDVSSAESFVFNVLVQVGTLVGVVAYFAKDIWAMVLGNWRAIVLRRGEFSIPAKEAWYLVLATIPAGMAGVMLKDGLKEKFAEPSWVGWFLFGTAGILMVGELIGGGDSHRERRIDFKKSLAMGFAQVLALLPGISRSGSTISVGLLSGLSRFGAARFSFLMSIPIIMGASLVAVKDLVEAGISADFVLPAMIGMATSAITGYFAIGLALRFLTSHRLYWFSIYCIFAGVFAIYVL